MALTMNNLTYRSEGQQVVVEGDVDFDSSYPTNGETLGGAELGLGQVDDLIMPPAQGLCFEWDKTNGKIKVFEQGFITGSSTVTDSTEGALIEDIAGTETVIRAMGTAVDTTYRFGVLKECANATDLSGITGVRFRAWGVG